MCFQRTAPDLNLTLSWLLQGCRPQPCWPSHLAPEAEVTEETQVGSRQTIDAAQNGLRSRNYHDQLCGFSTEHSDLYYYFFSSWPFT